MDLIKEIEREMRRLFPLIEQIHFEKDEEGTYTLYFTKRVRGEDRLIGPDVHKFLSKKIPLVGVLEVDYEAFKKLTRVTVKRDPKWL